MTRLLLLALLLSVSTAAAQKKKARVMWDYLGESHTKATLEDCDARGYGRATMVQNIQPGTGSQWRRFCFYSSKKLTR